MHARDHIGLNLGAYTPYVLRENVDNLAEEGAYAFVGECCLHGVMYASVSVVSQFPNFRI